MRIKTQEEMNNYIESNRHFILYAKSHYGLKINKIDSIVCLKVFLGEYCGVNVVHLTTNDVYQKILEIFFNVVEYRSQEIFWMDLFNWTNNTLTVEDIIKKLLNKIGICKVNERDDNLIIDLGEVDMNIFNLRRFKDAEKELND